MSDNKQLDLSPRTFEEAWRFCEIVTSSGLAPKGYEKKPNDAFIAIQWGAEVGLKPLQSLQNIAVINGRPSLWGDAVIALVRASPLCEYVKESDDGHTATCRAKRRGQDEEVRTFSIDDAKTAGLMGKQGPWTTNPKRMRQMRARAFALRDLFADVLKGIQVAEEVMDYDQSIEREKDITPQAEATQELPKPIVKRPISDAGLMDSIKKIIANELTKERLLERIELSEEQLKTLNSELPTLPEHTEDWSEQ